MRVERWGRLLWRLGASIWLGSIFFLFFAIAPHVFQVLPESQAGRLVDAIFPDYYADGLVFGGVMLLGALLRLGAGREVRRWVLTLVALVNWLLVWWAERILAAMSRISDATGQFHALHARSVVLSVVMFLVVLFGVVWEAVWI